MRAMRAKGNLGHNPIMSLGLVMEINEIYCCVKV